MRIILIAINFQHSTNGRTPKMPHNFLPSGPICVCYTSGDEVTKMFIMAERKVLCRCEHPTIYLAFKSLVGTYYAFNREYPLASKNFYDFIEFAIFKNTNIENTAQKFTAMKRKYVGV
jgi:hypothetical protein